MQAVMSANQLSETLENLTAELHLFLSRMHASRRQDLEDPKRLAQFRAKIAELAEQVQQVREMAGQGFVSFGERVANARDAAQATREAFGECMADMRDGALQRREALYESLDRMASQLRSMARDFADRPRGGVWSDWKQRLSKSYEELIRNVRKSRLTDSTTKELHLPHLKPTNYHRNVFHVAMGVVAVGLYELVLTYSATMWVLGILSAVVLTLEITRKIWPRWNDVLMNSIIFKRIHRPREFYRINSASVYALTLTGVAIAAPMTAVEVGLLVLAFADPAASIVGKRFGHKKIWRQKSWAGSLAFLAVGFAVAAGFLALKGALPTTGSLFLASGVTALAAAITETLSDRLDDNFTVLAMSSLVMALFI